MTGLFSLTYGNIAVSALIVCGIAALFGLAGRVVWYRVRVALDDRYYPPRPELHQYRVRLDEFADHARLANEVDLPGDREHSWPGMAPLLDEPVPDPDTYRLPDPTLYPVQAGSLVPDESEVEISHPRHAAPEPAVTAVFPVVDDERAFAAMANVPGEDGFL